MKITVDPEFKSNIPPLSDEEYAQLEKNILADGCRDPLVLWGQLLVDGHNRYAICTKHGLPFDIVQKEFASRDEALDWTDANQLGRRNLTPDQRSIIRGRRYNRTKKAAHSRPANTGGAKSPSAEVALQVNTAKALADQHGVTERTIRNDGKRAEAIERMLAAVVATTRKTDPKLELMRQRDSLESMKPNHSTQETTTTATGTEITAGVQPCR
jgi:hypothetical protein